MSWAPAEFPAPRGPLFFREGKRFEAPRSRTGANETYPGRVRLRREPMGATKCTSCGGPTEPGYLTTSNGSGLFWAHDAPTSRLRPKGLEVLVGTGFGGTFSASLPGVRCASCGTLRLTLPKSK